MATAETKKKPRWGTRVFFPGDYGARIGIPLHAHSCATRHSAGSLHAAMAIAKEYTPGGHQSLVVEVWPDPTAGERYPHPGRPAPADAVTYVFSYAPGAGRLALVDFTEGPYTRAVTARQKNV